MAGAGSIDVQSAKNLGDMVGNGGGELGFQYLMADDPETRGQLMANAGLLSEDEWESVSDTVRRVRKQRLELVNALRQAGLTKSLSLATYNDTWPTVSTFGGAKVGMNPSDTAREQGVTFGEDGAPLPVIHADWSIDRRRLLVSRATNADISSLVPAEMTKNVARTFERLCLEGWSRTVDGYEMFGFLNHPNRNQVAAPGSWSDDTNDAEDIRQTYLASVEALEDDEYGGGGYWIYHNRAEYQRLRRVTDTIGQGEQNMRSRVNEEFDVEIDRISQSPYVPAGEAVMFKPSPEVLNAGIAENVQPVQWDSPSGFKVNFKIFGAMNLELYSNQAGQTGFAHITGM